MPWFVQLGVALSVVFFFFGAQSATERAGGEAWASSAPSEASLEMRAARAALLDDGEKVYQTRCQSCHQMNGQGITGVFPPLTESEWVTGDKGRLTRLLLHGMTGPMEVGGMTYSGAMPPWNSALNDEQIAQVATYIRTSWGNDASAITAEEVARVRQATKERKKPWTADELNAEANQGIPEPSADER